MVRVNRCVFLLASADANDWKQVSESVGLLQTDSKQMSMLQMSRSMGTVNSSGEAGAVATTLLAMAKSHGRWNKTEQDALTPLIASLVAGFDEQLEEEHQSDQASWATETGKQDLCHTIASAKFVANGNVFLAQQEFTMRHAKLKSCHAVDKAWIDYEEVRTCESPVASVSFGEISEHDKNLGAAMTLLKSKVTLYHGTHLPDGCTSDQVKVEDQACSVRQLILSSCESQDECSTNVGLAETKITLMSKQDNRQASKLSFKKVICQVNKMLALTSEGEWNPDLGESAAAPDACDSTALDGGDLVLSLTMPTAAHCQKNQHPEVFVYPRMGNCSAWMGEQYSDWGSDFTVPTDCEVTCPLLTPVPAPAPTTTTLMIEPLQK